MQITLPKIRKYHLSSNGFSTNDLQLANKIAILKGGSVFEDTRQESRKRLQRLYFRAAEKGILKEIDYPDLISILKNK